MCIQQWEMTRRVLYSLLHLRLASVSATPTLQIVHH